MLIQQNHSSVSQEKIDNFAMLWPFCFYATVALECFCGSLLQIWLLCDQVTGVEYFKRFVWVYF